MEPPFFSYELPQGASLAPSASGCFTFESCYHLVTSQTAVAFSTSSVRRSVSLRRFEDSGTTGMTRSENAEVSSRPRYEQRRLTSVQIWLPNEARCTPKAHRGGQSHMRCEQAMSSEYSSKATPSTLRNSPSPVFARPAQGRKRMDRVDAT